MKNTLKFLTAIAVLLAAFAANAAESVRKSYDFKGFDSVDVSWIYNVELVRSNTFSVEVEVSEELKDYLEVKMIGRTLHLGVEKLPRNLANRSNWNPTVKAVVSLPELGQISMSGASVCQASDTFKTKGSLKVQLSGASKLTGLNAEADKLSLDCSGAAKYEVGGKFRQATLDLSGAAKGSLSLTADNISFNTSGAVSADCKVDCKSLEIDASGSSKLRFSGRADKESADCAGASDIALSDVSAKTASVELSGAAKCKVDAEQKLTVELTGASRCRYVRHPGLDLDVVSISRGASLEKM